MGASGAGYEPGAVPDDLRTGPDRLPDDNPRRGEAFRAPEAGETTGPGPGLARATGWRRPRHARAHRAEDQDIHA